MKELCDKLGLRFYVSDAHFKECSNNCCCCALNTNWDYSRGNFSSALQIAKKCGEVHWKDIERDMYFLEIDLKKSALLQSSDARGKFAGMSVKDYLHYLWNNPKMGQSPYKIFERVLKPSGYDENNDIIYKYDEETTFIKNENRLREEIIESRQ